MRKLYSILLFFQCFLFACDNKLKETSEAEKMESSATINALKKDSPDSIIEIREVSDFIVHVYTPSNDNPTMTEQGIIVYNHNENIISEMKYVKSFGNEWSSQSSSYTFNDNQIEISFESDQYNPGMEASDDPSIGVSMEELSQIDDPYLILDQTKFQKWNENYLIDTKGIIKKVGSKISHSKIEVSEFNRFDILPSERLRILRNAIFAQYGYKFNAIDLQQYFTQKSWYKAERENVDELLTNTDKKIISYLNKLENKKANSN